MSAQVALPHCVPRDPQSERVAGEFPLRFSFGRVPRAQGAVPRIRGSYSDGQPRASDRKRSFELRSLPGKSPGIRGDFGIFRPLILYRERKMAVSGTNSTVLAIESPLDMVEELIPCWISSDCAIFAVLGSLSAH